MSKLKVSYLSKKDIEKRGGLLSITYATPAGLYDFFCNEIYINKNLPRWTQFWAFLHEFGHWIMCQAFKMHPQYPRLNLFFTDFYDLISVALVPFAFKDKVSFVLWRLNHIKNDLFGKIRFDYTRVKKLKENK